MITAHHATVRRGATTVLHDLSLEIVPGEVLAVVGPNGAGKSTLLAALTGTLRPDTGQILLDGYPLHTHDARALARRRAVLLQHTHLTFAFTALDVVMMGRAPHGTHRAEQHARAAMRLVGVESLAERLYPHLSGGQQQRVQLARVLAQLGLERDDSAPRYLFLDEPNASLDLSSAMSLMELTRGLAARGIAVVVILHDLNLAAAYADSVLVLRDGRRARWGPPCDVFQPELLAQVFGLRATLLPHPTRAGAPLIVADMPVADLTHTAPPHTAHPHAPAPLSAPG